MALKLDPFCTCRLSPRKNGYWNILYIIVNSCRIVSLLKFKKWRNKQTHKYSRFRVTFIFEKMKTTLFQKGAIWLYGGFSYSHFSGRKGNIYYMTRPSRLFHAFRSERMKQEGQHGRSSKAV